MYIFSSYYDMISRLHECGYTKSSSARGTQYNLDPSFGTGTIEVWGDNASYSFIDIDVTYSKTEIFLNYSKNIGVQMTFIDDNDMEYYTDENDIEKVAYGSFFYVNHVCIPWFKKYKADDRVRAMTIAISDSFLTERGFSLSEEDWQRFARAVNTRKISLPEITAILKQIRHSSISEELFQSYLQTKILEAFIILWDFTKQQKDIKRISAKSHIAVKKSLEILTREYVNPPIIIELAKSVCLDKKTLQSAFHEIVGLSIHDYVRTLKLQKSLELLQNTDMTIENIANAVGYRSRIHFYKAIDTVFSMKPTEMRKTLKQREILCCE